MWQVSLCGIVPIDENVKHDFRYDLLFLSLPFARQERFAEMFGAENTSKLIPSPTQVRYITLSMILAMVMLKVIVMMLTMLTMMLVMMTMLQDATPKTSPGDSVLAGKGEVSFLGEQSKVKN